MTDDAYSRSIQDALEEIGYAAELMRRAKTPEDIKRAIANSSRFTDQISAETAIKLKSLEQELNSAYKGAGGEGAVPRRYKDKAARIRKNYRESINRTNADLRSWTGKQASKAGESKTDAALRFEIQRLREKGMGNRTAAEEKKFQELLTLNRKRVAQGPDTTVGDDPTVTYRRKNKNGSVTAYQVNAAKHMKMLESTAESMHRNLGVIAAASKKSGYVIVSDGVDCGRRGHDDGDKANGKIWSVDEAFAHPLGHPACRRTFYVADGPPGSKKLNDQLRGMGLRGQQKTNRQKAKQVAEVASKVSMVGSFAGAVVTNPFAKRFFREILSNTELDLPPAVRHMLTVLTSYGKRESSAFLEHGERLGLRTQQDFNDYIAHSFDEDFATNSFLLADLQDKIELRIEQARVLGLPKFVEKGRFLEAMDDYGDWLSHRDSMILSIEDRIKERRIMKEAREEVYGEAAIQFHLMRPPGLHTDRNWTRVAQDFVTVYRRNPERARVEAIKLVASVVNPTPWLKLSLPKNLSFSIGMPVRARQDIAVKLYNKATSHWTLSEVEVRWAQQLGMDLKALQELESRIDRNDIIGLLSPRISWAPGSLFHATINMDNGVIRPVFRTFPYGSLNRYINLENRLGRVDVKEFIKQMEKRTDLPMLERLRLALGESADTEMLTAINFFRNSPIQTSLYMNGLDPSGFAVKLLPDNKLVRYSYRVNFDQRAFYNNLLKDDLLTLADERGLANIYTESTRKQIINDLVDWDKAALKKFTQDLATGIKAGKTLEEIIAEQPAGVSELMQQIVDGWQTGLSVLPNRLLGFSLHNLDLNAREALVRMRVAGYSLIRISKETRLGYDSLLELFSERRAWLYGQAQDWRKTLQNIDSFADLKQTVRVSLRRGRKYEELFDVNAADVPIDHVDGIDLFKNQALAKDLEVFTQTWQSLYPGKRLPQIRVADFGAPLRHSGGTIFIRRDVAENWEEWTALRRKSVAVGHFAPDTGVGVASLFHEAAHTIIAELSPFELDQLKRSIVREYATWGRVKLGSTYATGADFDVWLRHPKNQKLIARRVSGYATTSWDELIAEAYSEYLTSANPRRIAQAVGWKLGPGNNIGRRIPESSRAVLAGEKLPPSNYIGSRDASVTLFEFSDDLHEFFDRLNTNRLALPLVNDGWTPRFGISNAITQDKFNEMINNRKWSSANGTNFISLKTRGGNEVSIDAEILNHPILGTNPTLIQEFMDFADDMKRLHPNLEVPKLELWKMDLGRRGYDHRDDGMQVGERFVFQGSNKIFIPEIRLYELALLPKEKEIFVAESFHNGWFPKTNLPWSHALLNHEVVHALHGLQMPLSSQVRLIEDLLTYEDDDLYSAAVSFLKSDAVRVEMRDLQALSDIEIVKLSKNPNPGIFDYADAGEPARDFYQQIIESPMDGFDGPSVLRTLTWMGTPSGYSLTNFSEYLAELVSQGMGVFLTIEDELAAIGYAGGTVTKRMIAKLVQRGIDVSEEEAYALFAYQRFMEYAGG